MPNMLSLDARFSQQPAANVDRSIIPRKSDVKTTFDFGYLVPIYNREILPGQSSKMSIGSLIRMSTPKFPVMDSAYMDIYAFFVPNRLVWNHWEEFMGENKDSAWVSSQEYQIPAYPMDDTEFNFCTLEDYMGLPVDFYFDDDYFISALPFRGYNLIWNEWFRDQNYQNPVPVNFGDDDSSNAYGLLKVCKLHDEFTSITPEPQKGSSVSLTFNGGLAPVYSLNGSDAAPMTNTEFVRYGLLNYGDQPDAMQFINTSSQQIANKYVGLGGPSTITGTGFNVSNAVVKTDTDLQDNASAGEIVGINQLYADLNFASISTINQLRNAIVVQQYLETLARGGSRYTEILRSLFGVVSPDARLQRPEMLGHVRIDINMQQVVQTSFVGGDSEGIVTPLGSTGGMSKTTGYNFLYEKSFVEHGHLFILACARTELSYQQGIDRQWTRKAVTDFYNPIFANIGNQPITYERIYATGDAAEDSQVFGYQEAWSEYRYTPNKVCGAFRSNHPQTLDAWHYSQFFDERPIAGSVFMTQQTDEIDRTLAYPGDVGQQLLCNFFFDEVATLPIPVYSIPGLARL